MEEKLNKTFKIVQATKKKLDDLTEKMKKLENGERELKAEIQTVK